MSKTRLLLRLASAASLSLVFAACSGRADEEDPMDALDSALSQQDFDTTVKHLGSLPWLPWTYLADGCYARALYYSMLLATKDVPTNHVYVVRKAGAPPLMGIWSWHVAPLVSKDGEPNTLYVLDPAYDQERALTNVEWVAKQNYPDPAATNYPNLHVHSGNSYLKQHSVVQRLENPGEPVAEDYKEPVIEDMPAFAMRDVSAACLRMHQYIDRETTTTTDQKAEKHRSLGRETQRLVRTLDAKGKISGAPTLTTACTRNEVLPQNVVDAGSPAGEGEGEEFVEPTREPVPGE